jgi:hypothetical protein
MIKHDKDAMKRRGQPEKGYAPRQPLAERLAAARQMEAERQQQAEPASVRSIQATEEDAGNDNDILAAISKADCVAAVVTQ